MRNLLIILLLLYPLFCNGKGSDYDFDKIIEKLDVDSATRNLTPSSSGHFWQSATDGDVSLALFDFEMDHNEQIRERVFDRVTDLSIPREHYEKSVMVQYQNLCDSLLLVAGVEDPALKFEIIRSDDINHFSFVSDSCFIIAVTSSLLDKEQVDSNILLGYVAHEVAHWALCHVERKKFRDIKQDDDAWNSGLPMNGLLGGLFYLAFADTEENQGKKAYVKKKKDIPTDTVKISTQKLLFNYSPEQVYQADLYAFRLMQKLGREHEYFTSVAILGNDYDTLYGKSHPKVRERVKFLRYVRDHPEVFNKENVKLAKKLAKKKEKQRKKQEKQGK